MPTVTPSSTGSSNQSPKDSRSSSPSSHLSLTSQHVRKTYSSSPVTSFHNIHDSTVKQTLDSANYTELSQQKRQPQFSIPRESFIMFLVKAIEKILSERETKKSQNVAVKIACEEALHILKTLRADSDSTESSHVPPLPSGGADNSNKGMLLADEKLLKPFQLACSMKSARVVTTAIDSLQKLIAYGHVPNDAVGNTGNVRIIEQIVTTICSCFQGVDTDDGIQLQVLKALLTVVTSPVVEIHGTDILLTIRTCYIICMATKNPVNQTTARATLTQIINIIFQRMEQVALEAAMMMEPSVDETGSVNKEGPSNNGDCDVLSPDDTVVVNHTATTAAEDGEETKTESATTVSAPADARPPEAKDEVPVREDTPECIAQAILEDILAANIPPASPENESATASDHPLDGELVNHSQTQVGTGSGEAASPVSSSAGSPSTVVTVDLELEADDQDRSAIDEFQLQQQQPEAMVVAMADVTQKDAFIVFRCLCRLLVKGFASKTTGSSRLSSSAEAKANAVRFKTLSLQLLLSIFQQPGRRFLTSDIFLAAIKRYLCIALLGNGVSVVPEVCGMSITIFLLLIHHFKPHLKRQIELFFKDVLLHILESPASAYSFEHRWIVMQALRRICADAQCVVDLYLNYDCDMSMANITERLIADLAKVAQGSASLGGSGADSGGSGGGASNSTGVLASQRQNLRTSALECLVLILRCMADWSQELYTSPESQSFLGQDASATAASATHSSSSTSLTAGTPPMANKQMSEEPAAVGAGTTITPNGFGRPLDDPNDFECRKAQKDIYETGIRLFNQRKAMQGIQLLQEHRLLDQSMEAVAKWLLVEQRLDRTRVGDFLGENNPYNLRVMYAYVDQFEFAKQDFVSSMRDLLSTFRLPGEAQKIDRLMEKFAARYCACNPRHSYFTSADTAYVLAFSIILLTTDLHSNQIKPHHKMSKADYIQVNRGINDSQDLPESFLAEIYDQIAQCGIELKTTYDISRLTEGASGAAVATASADRGQGQSSEASGNLDDSCDFTSATHCEHVRPMFKQAWTPFLAAFSVGLQNCDALDVAHLCLEGIQYAIRIACIFRMETERDAYVQALTRFTLLLTTSGGASSGGQWSGASAAGSASSRRPRHDLPFGGGAGSASGGSSASGPVSSPEAMKQKNIDSIRTLITVAHTDGNYLGRAWLEILRCVSQLDSTHLITFASSAAGGHHPSMANASVAPGVKQTGLLFRAANLAAPSPNGQQTSAGRRTHSTSSTATSASIASASPTGSLASMTSVGNLMEPGSLAASTVDSKKAAILQEVMGEIGSHSVMVAVDMIFDGSIRLNGDAIVDFVKALCQVSREELTLPQPRIFTLQKVVEISYYNMGRIRLQWSRIWEHIGEHFTTVGQSSNEYVAVFVIDSLRQLSMKLIQRGELPNFHFQKEFLRPFVSILDNPSSRGTRKMQDMVIRCISNIVISQFANIRSGWTNIFAVLHRVASTTDEVVLEMAFNTCSFIVSVVLIEHLHVVIDAFQPLVKVLADFACNQHFPDSSMEAIRLMRICAHIVAEHSTAFCTSSEHHQQQQSSSSSSPSSVSNLPCSPVPPAQPVADEDQVWLKGWMPVLCELFRVVNSCKLDVRTQALTVFFDVLKSYGDRFRPLWWKDTFAVIFRVFQHFRTGPSLSAASETTQLRLPEMSTVAPNMSLMEGTEWLNTTFNHTLFSVVDIFTKFYDVLSDILLDEVYSQLRWCCLQKHEQLARSGTSCLETLILSTGKKFTPDTWQRTIDVIVDLFAATVPHQLVTWRPETDSADLPVSLAVDQDEGPERHGNSSSGNRRRSGMSHYMARMHLFADLLIKCVVQYELIQTVDRILFYSAHSRNEDAHYYTEARSLAISSYPAYALALKVNATAGFERQSSANSWTPGAGGGLDKSALGNNSPGEDVTSVHRRETGAEDDVAEFDTDLDDYGVETVFEPNGSTRPTETWWFGPNKATRVRACARPLASDPRGLHACVSAQHRLLLARCLFESHAFAKQFNSNDEQRNMLFEAGFNVKAKPNLLKQETHSLLCGLRILFLLAEEASDVREAAEELLDRVLCEALTYYHSLVVGGHRQAWEPCLILIFTHLTRLSPATRFHRHATYLYPSVCDLIAMAGGVSPEVTALLRLFMLRCGAFFIPPPFSGTCSDE